VLASFNKDAHDEVGHLARDSSSQVVVEVERVFDRNELGRPFLAATEGWSHVAEHAQLTLPGPIQKCAQCFDEHEYSYFNWGCAGAVARMSQQGGAKNYNGGHISKYNVGCMQRPPRKSRL